MRYILISYNMFGMKMINKSAYMEMWNGIIVHM
jgi:hypothetical protein